MKLLTIPSLAALCFLGLCLVSCETVDKTPKPERERLSSMPHNVPADWEGSAGLPGGFAGSR
ncbi:MAG: hypothetical protein AAF357_13440 [Verrucomicrobiota bacterium]